MRSSIACTILFASLCIATASCKKENKVTATCNTTLYGYTASTADVNLLASYAINTFGTFDINTGATGTLAASYMSYTSKESGTSNQGAFNTADNCYYTLVDSGATPFLCKVSTAGALFRYSLTTDSIAFEGLVYNAITNKLLAIKRGTTDTLVEIIAGTGTSFSYTPILKVSNDWVKYYSATVDPNTGTLYLAANNYFPACCKIYKLPPGGTSFALVNSQANQMVQGLRYNSNDNMLYAMRYLQSAAVTQHYFIRISPAGGSTNICPMPIALNRNYYATCLDVCNNRYIIASSAYTTSGTNVVFHDTTSVYQLSMAGSVVQTNVIAGMFLGIDIKY